MADVDKTIVIGRLTDTPKLVKDGDNPFVTFSMAVNRRWTDKEGNLKEVPTFLDFEIGGKRSKVVCEYVKKGHALYVEGHHRMNEWETDGGEKRRRLVIHVDDFQFLERKEEG